MSPFFVRYFGKLFRKLLKEYFEVYDLNQIKLTLPIILLGKNSFYCLFFLTFNYGSFTYYVSSLGEGVQKFWGSEPC